MTKAAATQPAPAPAKARPPLLDDSPSPQGARRRPRPPFVLIWAPGRVTKLAGQVIPSLEHMDLSPGVAGVSLRKDGRWDVRGLIDDAHQRGARVLSQELDYCVESTPGSGDWVPAWAEVRSSGEIVLGQAAERRYVEMVRQWIDDGALPAPTSDEVEAYADRIRQIADQLTTQPGHAGRAAAIEALLPAAS